MKRTILTLIALLLTAPAQAAFLGENSRLGESSLNTGIEQVAGDVSQEGLPASGGAWLRGASEFFVAPATQSRQFWTRSTEFQGSKVYQRNDLINPKLIDPRGRTNLERMQRGLAPIGPDGKPLNVHHMLQTQNGPLAEMTQTFHQQNTSTIHINPNTIPSGIDRPAFEAWRQQYWMNRARGFGGGSP